MKILVKSIVFLCSIYLVTSCTDVNNNSSGTTNESSSVNGVYTYDGNDATSRVTVSSNSWSGKVIIKTGFGEDYDNSSASYSNGKVKDGKLYDESGYIELGSANGSTLTISVGSAGTLTHYK